MLVQPLVQIGATSTSNASDLEVVFTSYPVGQTHGDLSILSQLMSGIRIYLHTVLEWPMIEPLLPASVCENTSILFLFVKLK